MNTGQIISGTGHLALIGWALIGGTFQSAPPPFEVMQATTVSEAEFAAIMDRAASPEAVANVDTPEPPAEGQTAPQVTPEAETAPEAAPPRVEESTPPEGVEGAPPSMQVPSEDMAVMVPEVSPRPQPRPAPRVAPEAAPEPEPDTRVDDVTQPEVTPDEGAETAEEPSEATAPEEAAREIVTEAEETDAPAQAAPPASVRPRTRPDRPDPPQEAPTATAEAPSEPEPEPAPEPEPEPEPPQPASDRAAIDDALAAALGEAQQGTERPSGPPLTGGERDALRVAVQRCWNVGSLSSEALRTTVEVAVSMTREGRPDIGSIRLVGSSGGSDAAAKQAYEAARRAIIRCGTDGFDLPVEKYDQWREIEMTFNPESMRIR